MNIFRKNQSIEKTQDKKKFFFIIIIIIIALVIISIISFFIGEKHTKNQKSPIPIVNLSKNNSNYYQQKILGQEIYNWTGIIKEIQNSKLIVTTNVKNLEGAYITKDIITLIDKNTIINKWNLTKPPIKNQINNNKKEISSNVLSVGNKIIIKSTNDLNNNNETIAAEISLLITP